MNFILKVLFKEISIYLLNNQTVQVAVLVEIRLPTTTLDPGLTSYKYTMLSFGIQQLTGI